MSDWSVSRLYPSRVLDRSEYEPGRQPNVTLAALTIEAYADPNPYETAEAFAKYHHDDLAAMTLEDLDRERMAARLRRTFDPRPSEWLLNRLAKLDAIAARRRAGSR